MYPTYRLAGSNSINDRRPAGTLWLVVVDNLSHLSLVLPAQLYILLDRT
jgi:hypothetical protein